ncbi:MAG: hypothetical protein LBH75_03285 [Treponema sp.]|jgi:hypothetical protein|nr:hypothetical protein [Treponema sp.]
MVKRINISVLLLVVGAVVFAQTTGDGGFTARGDVTAIYTLGNAEESQALGSGRGDGAYETEKNGYYTSANAYLELKPENGFKQGDFLEAYLKIAATHRNGSFYEPLSLEYYGKNDFSVSFDTYYGRVSIFDAIAFNSPVALFLKAGKYKTETAYFGKISKYETESVLYMLKTANTYNYQIEGLYTGTESNPFKLHGLFTTNYKFDEATPRLYDKDGSVSDHGLPVVGEYAPQLFASVRLEDFNVAGNKLSAEVDYALNGVDIYSGNSVGGAVRFVLEPPDAEIKIPLGLSVGWFEKNIDVLSGTVGADTSTGGRNTTGMRDTLAIGVGTGVRYPLNDAMNIDGNLAGAFYNINHIYRDPLSIISLSLDAQFTYKQFIVGAGFVAGSLMNAVWQTKDGAGYTVPDNGGIKKTFSFAENMGYEVYTGIKFIPFKRAGNNVEGKFIIGFNQNKGISMNNTLESRADGQIKYRQVDSESVDMVETGGLFVKMEMKF